MWMTLLEINLIEVYCIGIWSVESHADWLTNCTSQVLTATLIITEVLKNTRSDKAKKLFDLCIQCDFV